VVAMLVCHMSVQVVVLLAGGCGNTVVSYSRGENDVVDDAEGSTV